MRRSEARELFDRMDANGSGFVDFAEFSGMFNNLVRCCCGCVVCECVCVSALRGDDVVGVCLDLMILSIFTRTHSGSRRPSVISLAVIYTPR